MSYQKNYPNGWQSGEAGGTPITPAALNNIEKGIANALPKDGTDPMTADLPMNGHRVTGLGNPQDDGDAVPLGYAEQHFALAIESAEYPGCYYRTVGGVVEWITPPMVPGVEYRTTERWNGNPVYAFHNVHTLESTFSGNASLDILTGIQNADECIRHQAKLGYYFLPYVDEGATTAVEGLSTNTGIFTLRNTGTGSWSAGYKLKYTFYYTKTTD